MAYKNLEAKKEYQRQWYLNHREECIQRAAINAKNNPNRPAIRRAWFKQNRKKNQDFLNSIKSDLKCKECGEDRFYCLDFHHKNPKEKERSIAASINCSQKFLLEEIAKCDVLCSNCHRAWHWENNNSEGE